MKVALISGLWPTPDNNGLDQIATQIEALGHTCSFYPYTVSELPNFDIMIGHSFGGMTACQFSVGPTLKYLALIEPVYYYWMVNWFGPGQHFTIPSNVQKADCFNRQGLRLPPSSTILNPSDLYQNHSIVGLDHANAPRDPFIISTILTAIKSL